MLKSHRYIAIIGDEKPKINVRGAHTATSWGAKAAS